MGQIDFTKDAKEIECLIRGMNPWPSAYTSLDGKTMKIIYEPSKKIDNVTKKIISKVVDSYSQIRNPFELVRKTHEEDPWKNTDLNQEIECDEIRKYYEKQPEKIYGV